MRLRFSADEYRGRVERAIQTMEKGELDALLITAEANYNYFSGMRHFTPWTTFTRAVLLILPKEKPPVLIVQGFLREDATRDSWISDIRSYSELTGTPIGLLTDTLQELGLAEGRIGAELGFEQRLGVPYLDFVAIQEKLPKAKFVDASDVLWSLRIIKSEAEIDSLRRACQISDRAFQACFAGTGEGMSELDAARVANQTVLDLGGEIGFNIVCSGPGNYSRVAGMPTDRLLQRGDMLWYDMGVIYNGYWSDYCRAGVIGGPTPEQERYQDLVVKVTKRGLEAIRPGVRASDVVRACGSAAEEFGLEFSFEAGRLGHGVGLMSTEPPHIAVYDDTKLQTGMVITLEPGVVNDSGAYIAEEIVAVTSDGHELLTTTTRELRAL